jgi:hypothetical protein
LCQACPENGELLLNAAQNIDIHEKMLCQGFRRETFNCSIKKLRTIKPRESVLFALNSGKN